MIDEKIYGIGFFKENKIIKEIEATSSELSFMTSLQNNGLLKDYDCYILYEFDEEKTNCFKHLW